MVFFINQQMFWRTLSKNWHKSSIGNFFYVLRYLFKNINRNVDNHSLANVNQCAAVKVFVLHLTDFRLGSKLYRMLESY